MVSLQTKSFSGKQKSVFAQQITRLKKRLNKIYILNENCDCLQTVWNI